MILTQCAVCAAPLGLALGKKCGRCSTRYCGQACQEQHWKEGGHDKICKKIKRGGGAEQYYADKNYKEAVAVAVEQCAEDTKGQTCYICTEVVHGRTGEGIVRMCACHTTEGFAHVSCLVEQAKVLNDEAEENNLEPQPRWARWSTCGLCEQDYRGVVGCALGWACWKTYVSRPEEDNIRRNAMTTLGCGLAHVARHEERLRVLEAQLATSVRFNPSERSVIIAWSNIANCYNQLGRQEKALAVRRDIYANSLVVTHWSEDQKIIYVLNLSKSLLDTKRYAEAKAFLREQVPKALRALHAEHRTYMSLRWNYATAICATDGASQGDLVEATTMFDELTQMTRRIYGSAHPLTEEIQARRRACAPSGEASRRHWEVTK